MWNMGFSARTILPADLLQKTYYMSGYGANKPITGVRDPLYVRVLILAAGDITLAFCTYDLTGMLFQDAQKIRRAVLDACPDLTDALLFFSHSHAAIDTIGLWGDFERGVSGRDPSYISLVRDTTVQAVSEAFGNMQPGRAYFAQREVRGVVDDTRMPSVSDHRLSQFKFEPENGPAIRLLHFTCHPEALGSQNTLVSSDYVGEMVRHIRKLSGDDSLFINGAIGGMQSDLPHYDLEGNPLSKEDTTAVIGKILANAALRMDSWRELAPNLTYRKIRALLPVDNSLYLTAADMGIVPKEEFVPGGKESEVGILQIGDVTAACIPGELFPELHLGGFLSDKDCAVPGIAPEPTVTDILGKGVLVFGLCNDEIGYILPENDFFLDEKAPYIARGFDRHGRRHYEETNSLGPKTARRIMETLAELAEKTN